MKFRILITAVIFLTVSEQSFCGGTEFTSFYGSKTMSLNSLYFGGIDGLNLTVKNPSGLAYLTQNLFDVSIIDQVGQHEFIPANMVHMSYRSDDFTVGAGFAFKLSEEFAVALSYAPVFDYRVEWPFLSIRSNDSLNLTLAFNMFNRIQVNSINPSAAMRFGSFAVGLSANIYMIDFKTAFPIENIMWNDGAGLASYQQDYKMDAWAYGFTLGLMADAMDNLRLGMSIRSGFKSSPEGDAVSEMMTDLYSTPEVVNIKTDFEVPWRFGLGLVYSLTPDLKINLDAEYSLWGSTSDEINFNFDNELWQSRLDHPDTLYGINAASFSFKNENSLSAGIGFEYYPMDYLAVRGGYRYAQTPNTAENYNFLFPNVSSHSLSIGLGISEENFTVDGAIIYSIGVAEEINNSNPPTSGSYDLDNVIPSVTISYRF